MDGIIQVLREHFGAKPISAFAFKFRQRDLHKITWSHKRLNRYFIHWTPAWWVSHKTPTSGCLSVRYILFISYIGRRLGEFHLNKSRGHQHNVVYLSGILCLFRQLDAGLVGFFHLRTVVTTKVVSMYGILYLFRQLDAGLVGFFHTQTVVSNIKWFICTVYYISFVHWTQAWWVSLI